MIQWVNILTPVSSEPREGYITSHGFKMHYLEWGKDGRPIVALHSMMMDAHGLDIFSRSMSRDNHILAIDLLGHGDSDKPDKNVTLEEHMETIRGVVLKKKFEQPIVIGHSMGGIVSFVYAATYPNEVSKLIMVDIAPRDLTKPRVATAVQLPKFFNSEKEALAFFKQRYPNFTQEAYENRMQYGIVKDEDGKLRLKNSTTTINILLKWLDMDLWPYARQIRAPTLLIKATESETVSPTSLEMMKREVMDFHIIEISKSTHMVPQDRPREFEETVRTFIK